jgi:hypothetical protein
MCFTKRITSKTLFGGILLRSIYRDALLTEKKNWSFTDCNSFSERPFPLMARRKISPYDASKPIMRYFDHIFLIDHDTIGFTHALETS